VVRRLHEYVKQQRDQNAEDDAYHRCPTMFASLKFVHGSLLPSLLNRACHGRERIIGIAADQPNGTHNKHQNYGQNYRVLSDVLSALIAPKSTVELFMVHLGFYLKALNYGARQKPREND
jgi:hypothetical protein